MKLKEIHLFLILLGVLLLSNLGFIIKEGLVNPQTQTMAMGTTAQYKKYIAEHGDDGRSDLYRPSSKGPLNTAVEAYKDESTSLDSQAGSSGFYKNSPPATGAAGSAATDGTDVVSDLAQGLAKAVSSGWHAAAAAHDRGGNRNMEAAAAAGTLATPAKEGKEGLASDQYILKSSIVPPVCPRCPSLDGGGGGGGGGGGVSSDPNSRQKCKTQACPPCPACARCPEQPFTCKKVPDYNHIDSTQLPKPVLTNFSKFSS